MKTPTPTKEKSIFPATRWSLILDANQASGGDTMSALGELCQSYWYPLYVCARRSGLSPTDSEDCVQSFLGRLLENRSFETVAEERGRLRAFLQAAMKNFLTQQWHKGKRQKRGGGAIHLSIDQEWGEEQLKREPAAASDPETEFDRSWAYALLNTVFSKLEVYYEKRGKSEIYEAIKGCLQGDGKYDSSSAEKLGLSSEGLRSNVFKLRRRFREYIEAEVRETCVDDDDAREEIRYLCLILAT